MKFKKSELFNVLTLTQFQQNNDGEITHGGLLLEKISLGLKRRLQKIVSLMHPLYQEYLKDRAEVEKLPEGEEKTKELFDLDNEEVTIDHEPVSLAMIEAIETSTNYNWDLIEKIAK